MIFLRQHIAPFFILVIFLVALLAVSARIFLPSDMALPAPVAGVQESTTTSERPLSPALSMLVNGSANDRLR